MLVFPSKFQLHLTDLITEAFQIFLSFSQLFVGFFNLFWEEKKSILCIVVQRKASLAEIFIKEHDYMLC